MLITKSISLPKGGEATGNIFDVKNMDSLTEVMLNETYSLSIFKDNVLQKPNFISACSIALDFDKDFTLEEANKVFKEYKHIIATTKSHQKKKNGIICDRFRVIIFLSNIIRDNETFFATYKSLQQQFPQLDPQCKNSNRWFYPSQDVISVNKKGKLVDPIKPLEVRTEITEDSFIKLPGKGKLAQSTRKMLKLGIESGSRNGETFKIAKDFQENGYTEDEAVKFIVKAFDENGTLAYDFTDYEVENTVRSAYSSDPTNSPRKPFKLVPMKELYRTTQKMEWVMEGLLTKGGISLMSAAPKAGKSQIARQIMKCMSIGEPFFGRDTKKGEVHYYAIEEQPEIINEAFKKMELPADAPIYVHTGEIYSETPLKEFYKILKERKPVLAVIDTLFDLLDVESENNYKEVKKELRNLRQIARSTGTHILCIHHSNKSYGGVTGGHKGVLGSQAIVGGVDTIIMLELSGDTRVITTMGRSVKRWVTRELIWDDTKDVYKLGKKIQVDEF